MLPSIANGFPDPYNGLRLAALLLLAEKRERPGERTVWPLVATRGLTAFGSHVLHAAKSIVATNDNDGCNFLLRVGFPFRKPPNLNRMRSRDFLTVSWQQLFVAKNTARLVRIDK